MNSQSITPRASVPPRVTVTQATLREYQALAAQVRRRHELREQLAEALAAGAAVEPGDLAAKLLSREYRSLTIAKVTAAIGDAGTQSLLGLIGLTTRQTLEVRAAAARS